MLANLSDELVADTLHPESSGGRFPFAKLAATARERGEAAGNVLIDDRAYDLVLVPVRAPTPIGWLAMGFLIDDKFARRLESLTALEVSFLNQTSGGWNLLATTLPPEKKPALLAALGPPPRSCASTARPLRRRPTCPPGPS